VRLEAERFTIRLPRPFRIAHGSSVTREAILVHLYDDQEGIAAHGEGALPPYYPSTAEASLSWLDDVAGAGDAAAWEIACTSHRSPESAAARVALETALQDLRAQKHGKPLWRLWSLDPARTPPCWMTLSIPASEKELCDLLAEGISRGSKRIKLKTGSGDLGWDETCLRLASKWPVRLGLDANGGWTPKQAANILSRCPDIVFAEQPVSREFGWWNELRSRVRGIKIPLLIADESLQIDSDLASLRGLADGVNVKILKAGGLDAARRWISLARRWGMGIMVGTMVETGIGRTAAAQLAPLADWLDIDSPESIPAAPMIGFSIEGGRLVLGDRPGLGLRKV
jgi:L-alanine-DL-glutamate epimerase-like enolase superfamily enzyme